MLDDTASIQQKKILVYIYNVANIFETYSGVWAMLYVGERSDRMPVPPCYRLM